MRGEIKIWKGNDSKPPMVVFIHYANGDTCKCSQITKDSLETDNQIVERENFDAKVSDMESFVLSKYKSLLSKWKVDRNAEAEKMVKFLKEAWRVDGTVEPMKNLNSLNLEESHFRLEDSKRGVFYMTISKEKK